MALHIVDIAFAVHADLHINSDDISAILTKKKETN